MTDAQRKRAARRAQAGRAALLRSIDARRKPRVWRVEHDDGNGPYFTDLRRPGWHEVREDLLDLTNRHTLSGGAIIARLNTFNKLHPMPQPERDYRFGTTTWAGLVSYFGPYLFTLADYGFWVAQVEVPEEWVIVGDHGVVAYASRHAVTLRRVPLRPFLYARGESVIERVMHVQDEINLAQALGVFDDLEAPE